MAILNKLRNSTWVLIIVLASLVLFVVSDYFSSNSKFGMGGSQTIGVIAGTEITYLEFDAKYKDLINQLTANGSEENDQTKDQASNFAWNQFIQSLIIDKEFAKLGIDISGNEAAKLLYTNDAHPTIKQYFSRDGEFSPSNVINFKNQMAKKDPKMMVQFEMILKQVFMEVQSRKYNSLVKNSIYATSLDAEDDYFRTAQTFNGTAVTLNYASIEDKSIKIEDSELKKYIDNHKSDFQQKASRSLEYILINVTPSREDSLEIKNELTSDIIDFASAEDDSIYVMLNSTEPYTTNFQSHGSFNQAFEANLFNTPKDSIFGPVYYDGGYSIFKIKDKKQDSVFYFHAIKADLAIKGTTKLDSLEAVAKGKQFGLESNLADNSLDYFNTKVNSGDITYAQDLGWLREGTQADEVNNAIKILSPGQSTVVKSIYGLSIIKLLDPKSKDLIDVAEVRKLVEPLKETENEAYQKASNFRNALTGDKKDEFDEQTKKFGIAKSVAINIKESDRSMTGISGTIDIIRWAFGENRKIGDYSDVLVIDNLLFVTHLTNIKKEGVADLEDVREEVKILVLKEKKAELLKKQLENASKGAKTIEDIAIAVKSIAQPFENVSFNNNSIQYTGSDEDLVGIVCGLKQGVLSKPVVSKDGVHLFLVNKSGKPEIPKDLNSRKAIIFEQNKQQVYNSVFEALKKSAKVVDERYKFY